jgi:tetratricopeptide (TPR) repeat protein
MSFDNLDYGRIFQVVLLIAAIGIVLSLGAQMIYGIARGLSAIADLDPNASPDEQQERIQEEMDKMLEESMKGWSVLTTLSIIQWTITALVTFYITRRMIRRTARTPQQATGYGLLIGLGVLFIYGLCILFAPGTAPEVILLKLVFMGLVVAAGAMGGRSAGQNLAPATPRPGGQPEQPRAPYHPPSAPSGPGGNPEVYYNMGTSAALGGRREEARQHFTHVLQMQPQHVAAWLQLANLAETPQQAWNYIQQARAIDANNPAVQEAVSMIWPQVHAASQAKQAPAPPPAPEEQPTPPDELDEPDEPADDDVLPPESSR